MPDDHSGAGRAGARSSGRTKLTSGRLYPERTPASRVDPDSIFDVQVKRLHEYKRQHLNALHILAHLPVPQGRTPSTDFHPRTYHLRRQGRPGLLPGQADHPLHLHPGRAMIDADPAVRGQAEGRLPGGIQCYPGGAADARQRRSASRSPWPGPRPPAPAT